MDPLLKEISDKLDRIIQILEEHVVKDCDKMREHIDFVESVYDVVKGPFNKLISFTSPSASRELENIEK